MKICFDGGFFIESDPMCWMVKQATTIKTGKKAGQERDEVLGYYGSLSQAVTALAHRQVRVSGAEGLEQALTAVNEISERIRGRLEPEYEVTAR